MAKPKAKKRKNAKPKARRKLTPAQRRRRRIRRHDDTLYNPARVLGGRDLRKSVNRLVTGEIRPQVNEINRQIKTGRAQTDVLSQRAGSYFTQLAGEEQKAIDTTRVLSERLNTDLAGVAGQASAGIDTAEAQARARLEQDAAHRGQGLDGGSAAKIAAETAAQRAVQANTAQAFQSAGQMQGAGYEGMAQMAKAASASRGADIQGQLAARQQANEQELRAERGELQAMKGPLRTKLLMQLRQAGFEQLATQLGLDLKADDLQAEIELARQRDRTTRRGQNIARRGQDVSANTQRRGQDMTFRTGELNRQSSWDRALLGARKPTNESQSAKTMKRDVENTLRRAIDLTNKKFKGEYKNADQLEQRIRRHMSKGSSRTEPLIVDVTMDLFRGKGLSDASVKALKRQGVRIPREWTRKFANRKPTPRRR